MDKIFGLPADVVIELLVFIFVAFTILVAIDVILDICRVVRGNKDRARKLKRKQVKADTKFLEMASLLIQEAEREAQPNFKTRFNQGGHVQDDSVQDAEYYEL